MTAGHFVSWCHRWCETLRKCVKCFTPFADILFSSDDCTPWAGGPNIARAWSEQPLFVTPEGICHRAQPWSVTPKWGMTLIVGTSSALPCVCLSSCWLDSGGVDSACTCMHAWWCACMAEWACAASVNCCMCPLDLEHELCGPVPVWQNAGHALPLHARHNERTLGSLFICHVYSGVPGNLIRIQFQTCSCVSSSSMITSDMLWIPLSHLPLADMRSDLSDSSRLNREILLLI